MTARHGWLMVALLAVLTAGCQDTTRMIGIGNDGPAAVPEPDSLVAQPRSPLNDVPMPVGFSLTERKSLSMAGPGLRMVDHWYAGREDKWQVARFFKRQMPAAGWAIQADRMVRGDVVLDYVKGRERAVVTVTDGSWGKTDVHVQIYLSDQGAVAVGR